MIKLFILFAIFLSAVSAQALSDFCRKVDLQNLPVMPIEKPVITRILVSKKNKQVILFQNDQIVRTYNAVFGRNLEGHKVQEGDSKTPEGVYFIESKNSRSAFHLALKVSYPNAEDRKRAKAIGVSAGGDIMIHGTPTVTEDRAKETKRILMEELQSLGINWTDGCIAVTNPEIEEIYSLVKAKTPIEICPL